MDQKWTTQLLSAASDTGQAARLLCPPFLSKHMLCKSLSSPLFLHFSAEACPAHLCLLHSASISQGRHTLHIFVFSLASSIFFNNHCHLGPSTAWHLHKDAGRRCFLDIMTFIVRNMSRFWRSTNPNISCLGWFAEARETLHGSPSSHVYSVQPCLPKDPAQLFAAEFVQAQELFKQPSDVNNCLRDNRYLTFFYQTCCAHLEVFIGE